MAVSTRCSTRFTATLDGLGLDQVTLLGHSFGGGIELGFAARFPGRVVELVFSDTLAVSREWGLADEARAPSPGAARTGHARWRRAAFARSWIDPSPSARRGRRGGVSPVTGTARPRRAPAPASCPHVLWANRDSILSRQRRGAIRAGARRVVHGGRRAPDGGRSTTIGCSRSPTSSSRISRHSSSTHCRFGVIVVGNLTATVGGRRHGRRLGAARRALGDRGTRRRAATRVLRRSCSTGRSATGPSCRSRPAWAAPSPVRPDTSAKANAAAIALYIQVRDIRASLARGDRAGRHRDLRALRHPRWSHPGAHHRPRGEPGDVGPAVDVARPPKRQSRVCVAPGGEARGVDERGPPADGGVVPTHARPRRRRLPMIPTSSPRAIRRRHRAPWCGAACRAGCRGTRSGSPGRRRGTRPHRRRGEPERDDFDDGHVRGLHRLASTRRWERADGHPSHLEPGRAGIRRTR